MKRKPKKVEYKDTNIFDFAPKYEYPLKVRGRWLAFYALSKNYIKIINYAIKFRQPEKLLAVYLYGDLENTKIDKYMTKVGSENLYVFVWRGINELINVFTEYEKLMSTLKVRGFARDGEITPLYFKERDKYYLTELKYGEASVLTKEYHDNDMKMIAHTAAVEEFTNKIKSEVYTNGAPIDPQSHYEWLFETAKKEFPLGVEADTDSLNAYKTIAISKLLGSIADKDTTLREKYGISITDDKKTRQLSMFDRISNASVMVNVARNFANREIKNHGIVFHEAIVYELRKKPFGWYAQNNYYAYVLGYALLGLCNIPDIACSDTVGAFDYSGSQALWFAETTAKNTFRRRYQLILFVNTPEAQLLSNVLYRLFDLPEIKNSHGEAKYLKCTLARIAIEINTKFTRYPYSDVDIKLWELLNALDPIYDKRYKEFADYFEQNMDSLKQKLIENDKIQKQKLVDKYGQKEADFIEKYYARPKCYYQQYLEQGEFDEMAEKYHRALHCRECGRIIDNLSQAYEDDSSQPSGKKIVEFSLKEVIGLNKKLLSIGQDNMFCIDCLMEYCEVSSPQILKEHIKGWKAQGCELFL